MRPLSVGSVLSQSFSIWLKNLVPFTILTVLVYSPVLIYSLMFISGTITVDGLVTYGYVGMVGSLLLGLIVTGAITYGVIEQLAGRHASLGKCLTVGLSRMFPILGVGLLSSLLVGLGFLALFVPGVIIYCMLWLAVPVAVAEPGVGVMGALSRSKDLTSGVKGTIFGIVFMIILLEGGISFVLEKAFTGPGSSMGDVKLYLVLVMALSIVLMTIRSVANAVAYHDVRTAKEGIDIDELAAVFE
jgi:uncharacterized membrane protein